MLEGCPGEETRTVRVAWMVVVLRHKLTGIGGGW